MTDSNKQSTNVFDVRPAAMVRWIEELPRASIGKTAEMIYHALKDITAQEMKGSVLFRALESLRESVHYVTDNMHKHITQNNQPVNERSIKVVSASQAIFDLMSKGYRRVYYEMQKLNFLFVDKKILTTALHRALTYINRSLLLCYETYAAYHHTYWEKLHELYQYAEIHKLEKANIADSYLVTKPKTTVFEEYARNILLFLAEPHHLRTGEIHKVNEITERICGLLKLERLDERHKENPKIAVIELDQDQPPQMPGNSPLSSDIEHCRLINTDKVIEFLNKQVEQTSGQNADKIQRRIIKKIITSWTENRRRRHERKQAFEQVNITVSLHNTHMQLLYNKLEETPSNNQKKHNLSSMSGRFESIEVTAIADERPDIWSTVYNWASNNKVNSSATKPSQKEKQVQSVKQENWTLTNESAEGFCLLTTEKQFEKIQVGEVISIERENSQHRSIGIIRWLKSYGKQGVEIGGLLLSPYASPVGITVTDANTRDKIIDRGLIIPETSSTQPESLLTFSRQYKTGDTVDITQVDNDTATIRIEKLISDNGIVCQFKYKILGTHSETEDHTPTLDDIRLGRFDDVWKSI